jgi:hypothetical protein
LFSFVSGIGIGDWSKRALCSGIDGGFGVGFLRLEILRTAPVQLHARLVRFRKIYRKIYRTIEE